MGTTSTHTQAEPGAEPGAESGRGLGVGLRGRPLRHAAVAALLGAGMPLDVGQVLAAMEARGLRVDAAYPRKAVADALAYEHGRGWAVRTRRGTYAVGEFSRSTRWRLLRQYG